MLNFGGVIAHTQATIGFCTRLTTLTTFCPYSSQRRTSVAFVSTAAGRPEARMYD